MVNVENEEQASRRRSSAKVELAADAWTGLHKRTWARHPPEPATRFLGHVTVYMSCLYGRLMLLLLSPTNSLHSARQVLLFQDK